MGTARRFERTAVRALGAAIATLFSLVAVALVVVPSHRTSVLQLASRPITGVAGGASEELRPTRPTLVATSSAPGKVPALRVQPARVRRAPIPPTAVDVARFRTGEPAGGYGCAAAVAYLSAHAAKGFTFVCPGYALGHQAMTCVNIPGACPGQNLIVIADPCPAAYENEAWNSLLDVGLVSGRIDPFGSCP